MNGSRPGDDGVDPDDGGTIDAADAPALDVPAPDPAEAVAPARLSPFSLEGRTVPGLYLAAWASVVAGFAFLAVGVAAGRNGAIPFIVALVLLAFGFVAAAGSQAIERRRRPELPYHGPSPLLVFAAVVPLLVLAALVVLPLALLGIGPTSPIAAAAILAVTAAIYAGLVRMLVVGTGALTWTEMGLGQTRGRAIADFGYGLAFGIPVLVLTALVAAVVQAFLVPLGLPTEIPGTLPPAGDGAGLVANLVAAAILAPIGEELFFRGFATTAWARSIGPSAAIVRGAVFFALAHVLTVTADDPRTGLLLAVFGFAARLPVGLVLGWVFLRRRSLAAAIGVHAAFNASIVLIAAAAAGVTPA